jgi:hypothetical protein
MVATGGSLRVMFAIHEQRYGNRFMVRADESLTAFWISNEGDSRLRQMIATAVW